jgi:predicted PurR-regulated permease PerM
VTLFQRKQGPSGPETSAADAEATPTASRTFVPEWYRRVGVASWYTIGIAGVLFGLIYLLDLLSTLVVPTLFAILLGATFMPAVDWLERHRVGRAWGAMIVTVLVLLGAFAILALMTVGIVRQWSTIEAQFQSGLNAINDALASVDIDPSFIDSAKKTLTENASAAAKGLFGGAVAGISSLATFLFAAFIGINILVYVLVGGRKIGAWCSHHMGPVPQPVGYSILADSARFLRGYIWGSTLIGLFNGAVVGVGALIIGTPLAFTIAIVQWFSNYIPMFGALIGGAFAVMIALGTGGITQAIWMLIFVLIANGPLQTVISQFALGASLKLNGLVVLFATTGGAILAGALGGVFAAPFVKIGMDAYGKLRRAGVLNESSAFEAGGEARREPELTESPPGGEAAKPAGD